MEVLTHIVYLLLMLKKLLLVILSLVLALCVVGCDKLPFGSATPDETDYSLIFTHEGDTITGLTDYGKTLSSITIPSEIDGNKITVISKLLAAYDILKCQHII